MDKIYDPASIEQSWYAQWETRNYFAPRGDGQPYCVMIPPPNVTGSLHMGHGFQHTIMDALVRYHRMEGDNTLWQVGTDHAGISTQMVVEQQLYQENKTRHDFGREDFVQKIWQWKETSGSHITQQMRRLGTSVDWSRERFTLDEGLSKAVQKVFIELYSEGLIYRGKRLINWDPVLLTAISDLEVTASEEDGSLWYIRYPLVDSQESLTIATTRPETLLADVAVAVHPEDERYQHLIGKQAKLPLTERTIPIIADEYVDPEFGSGCVKITPAHDFNDYAIGQRHQLATINIFTQEATLNDQAPAAYQGMDRFDARMQVVKDLTAQGLLLETRAHKLKIPRGEKSGAIVEPYLMDQWFVSTKPLAEQAIKVVENGEIRFVPDNWKNTYFQWLNNIEDWCISRQLWWGHRIPAWYDEVGNIYVEESESKVRQKYQLDKSVKLHQDADVLDTWFSSALWPFSTLGWPEKTPELETYYPTNVLVTGFDIIFFWVARMVMMGLKFTGKIPFKDIYITGLIRDADGQKMSKSKGNVIDPIDVIDGIDLPGLLAKRTRHLMLSSAKEKIEKLTRKEFPAGIPAFGTDALRFTFCALAGTGRDVRFDLERVAGYRNFCNKLWNATRYVLMNSKNQVDDLGDGPIEYALADDWIFSRLQQAIGKVRHHFESYRFDLLANKLYDFVWHEYCDWYLELSKPILYEDTVSAAQKRGTHQALLKVLASILRLLHPIIPFITEEIWQKVAPLISENAESIMLQPYPAINENLINHEVEHEIHWLQAVITAIRQIRSEMSISPNQRIQVILHKGDKTDKARWKKHANYLLRLAKLSAIDWLNPAEQPPPAATSLVGNMKILIPLAGLIDKEAETQRLQKEINRLQQDCERINVKLNNPQFLDRAPQPVITKEKARLQEAQAALEKLQGQLEALR